MILKSVNIKPQLTIQACKALLFLSFLTIFADHCPGAVIESKRLRVKHRVECYIPYASNLPIDKKDNSVTHLIIAVYSSGSHVYKGCIELLAKYHNQNNDVIVISPQFLTANQVDNNTEENLLYWKVRPFYGSKLSATKSFDGDLRISAYNILEDIISDFCDKEVFPNLKTITILGHSAGGQMVNRFAASNTVEFDKARPQKVMIKYITMNPSSYIYFSPKRSVNWSRKNFQVPSATEIESNPGYNNYAYGLNSLYYFHRKKGLTPERMKELYPLRNVVYLLGGEEYVPIGHMSTHPSAMMQGRNRLERGRIYFGHLIDEFGPGIKDNQKFRIAKGVGHNGRKMILSAPARAYILKNSK